MTERIIPIDRVNPGRFFGPDNANIKFIKKSFPKLKISSRGDEIKVSGESAAVADFQVKIQRMFDYLENHPQLTAQEIKSIIGDEQPDSDPSDSTLSPPIVFGPKGKVVRARTANQKRLVQEVDKNDVVFAVGPAGTGKTYTAVALAVRALKNKEVKKLILARPAVEAGRALASCLEI